MPAVEVWSGSAWLRAFNRQSVFRPTLTADDTDQTASLNAQIAAIPDGTALEPVTIFLPSGNFRIDGIVAISSREWLIIDGEGNFNHYSDLTGVEASVADRAHWRFSGSNDCVLRRISVRGPNDQRDVSDPRMALYLEALVNEHGVGIQGASERITVELVTIDQVHGDTVYVGGTGDPNLDITLKNITGTYMGRQGLGIVLVNGLLVEDCDIQWGGRSGCDIEPNHNSHMVWNATFRRCTFGCQFYPWIAGGSGSDITPTVFNILIEDCFGVNTTSAHTALLANCDDPDTITIRRHTDLRNRSTQCMTFNNWGGTVTVEDCVVTSGASTPTSYGVVLSNCDAAVTITGNTFNGVSGAVGAGGADELYGVNIVGAGAEPVSITTCGNEWNRGGSHDGACS